MIVASGAYFAWLLVSITSIASVLGSLVIYVDIIWNAISKRHFSILHSDPFLGVSLSISCGTLIITSLNALLPKSVSYILDAYPAYTTKQAYQLIVPAFFLGSLLCLLLNYIVLKFASESLAPCPHDLDTLSRQHTVIVHGSHEHLPLLENEAHDHGAVHCSHRHDAEQHIGVESHSTHHHFPQTSNKRLLALSLQTTLGICVHRLPEGLMLFATSKADSELGLSLMLALSIHSFSEGFSVAAPLYSAIQNRFKVILFTILLVCGPQILGAYIGSKIFTSDVMPDKSMFHFGLCMASTAGFMLVVCTQLIGNAFRYVSQDTVLAGVLTGVLISLGSRAI